MIMKLPQSTPPSTENLTKFSTLADISISYRERREQAKSQRLQSTRKNLNPRSEIFHLGILVGDLCQSILLHPPPTNENNTPGIMRKNAEEIGRPMATLLLGLLYACNAVCGMNLRTCILKKIELNGRKYPVELCKGKSGKYTKYSNQTGITKTEGQSTIEINENDGNSSSSTVSTASTDSDQDDTPSATNSQTVEGVTSLIAKFATDRNWAKYHTPRNIALALMGELGELAELFQWKGDEDDVPLDDDNHWTEEERDYVGQEFADVSIYLLRLANVCEVEIGRVAVEIGTAGDGE